MFWQEDNIEPPYVVPETIVDLVFKIDSGSLPVDHAYALSEALFTLLPWLKDEEDCGIHRIKGTLSKNDHDDNKEPDMLLLSRRSKLILRLPEHRLEDARKLSGQTLDIAGYSLTLGKTSNRLLSTLTTIYAPYVIDHHDDENRLVQNIVDELVSMDIKVKKLICGKSSYLNTPEEQILTRGVLLAELDVEDSVKLQQYGLGSKRKLGCGLFVPHKGIAANVEAPD